MSFEKNEWKVEEDETVIVDPAARKQEVIFHYYLPTPRNDFPSFKLLISRCA